MGERLGEYAGVVLSVGGNVDNRLKLFTLIDV